jgi:PAS domain S-box-containing protein
MAQFLKSLTFKIGVIILAANLLVLTVGGFLFAQRAWDEVAQEINVHASKPALLIQQGLINNSTFSNKSDLEKIIGNEVLDALLFDSNGTIRFAVNPDNINKTFQELPGIQSSWIDQSVNGNFSEIVREKPDSYLINITPIFEDGNSLPSYYAFLKVSLTNADQEKVNLMRLILIGMVISILASLGLILILFRLMIFKRIQNLMGVLKKAQEGNLGARVVGKISSDEIGALQSGANSLIDHLQQSNQSLGVRQEDLDQAEKTLKEREERLQLVLEGADLGLWDENFQTGDAFYDDRWAEMLGYKLEEIEPRIYTWENLVHPQDLPRVIKNFNEHSQGLMPYSETEVRLLSKTGEWKWILSRGKIVERNSDGSPLRAVGTHLDISERKKAEKLQQALFQISQASSSTRNLEELYPSIHAIIGDLFPAKNMLILRYDEATDIISTAYLVDEEIAGPLFDYKLNNQGLVGYLMRRDISLLIKREEIDNLIQRGELQAKTDGKKAFEWMGAPLKTADGNFIGALIIQTYDEGVHYKEADRDLLSFVSAQVGLVIEKKQGEESLLASEQRLELALAGANLGIWDYNFKTDKAIRNERWAEILEYRLDEIEPDPKWMDHLIHPDDLTMAEKNMKAHVQGETPSYEVEFRVLSRSGEWRWILDRGRIIERESNGTPIRMVGTHLDITERKKSEKLQETLYRISEASSKAQNLIELYGQVHNIVSELLPAENFYMALINHNTTHSTVTFPYFVDTQDPDQPLPIEFDTLQKRGGLTAHLLRKGEALLIDAETDQKLVQSGEVETAGLPMLQWLGAPLKNSDGKVSGAMVVQSYREGVKYRESDKYILAFVASQVSMAIERTRALNALRESEERFRNIFEQSYEGVILVDEEGSIIAWNSAAAQITGMPSSKILGTKIWDMQYEFLVPEKQTQEHFNHLHDLHQQLFETGNAPFINRMLEVQIHNKDGKLIDIQQVAFPIQTDKGYMLALLSQDITERKRTENELQRQYLQMAALRTIDNAIAASFDLKTLLNILLDQIVDQLNVDAAAILQYNPKTQTLDFAAGKGFHGEVLQHTHLRLGESYAGQAALQRQKISVENINDTTNPLVRALALQSEKFFTYIGIPLMAKGQLQGVLEILHRSVLTPEPGWYNFLDALGGQTAIAIDNANLFSQLQQTNLDLSMAYDTTLEGWARALELRDMETEGHSRRITEMTVELAGLMGIKNDDLLNIRRGALLHDIGKMGIPDHILLKPGPLTGKEWQLMRKHPVYAYDMLSPIEFLRPSLDIPLYHHEKWDGSGYPEGLKGDQIPIAARIFAVVDVWDSLIHDRPYKKAWLKDKVIDYIRDETGRHFDPIVVKIFLKTIENTRRR